MTKPQLHHLKQFVYQNGYDKEVIEVLKQFVQFMDYTPITQTETKEVFNTDNYRAKQWGFYPFNS